MDLDITKMKREEILHILDTYPNGHLKIKNDRAFWSTEVDGQFHPSASPVGAERYNQQPQQAPQPKSSNPFDRMGDSLFRSVCG